MVEESPRQARPFSFLKKLDIFGEPTPTLSFQGEHEVRTYPGSFLSIIIFSLISTYSLLKLQDMLQYKRPSIISIVDKDGVDSTESYAT